MAWGALPFCPLKRMAGDGLPCALCAHFLHDYLDNSLRLSFLNRPALAAKLLPIFLRDILADLREVMSNDPFMEHCIRRCRRLEKKEKAQAIEAFLRLDRRLRETLNVWAILCVEAGIKDFKAIDTWVSHTQYEIFMTIRDIHEEHKDKREVKGFDMPFLEI